MLPIALEAVADAVLRLGVADDAFAAAVRLHRLRATRTPSLRSVYASESSAVAPGGAPAAADAHDAAAPGTAAGVSKASPEACRAASLQPRFLPVHDAPDAVAAAKARLQLATLPSLQPPNSLDASARVPHTPDTCALSRKATLNAHEAPNTGSSGAVALWSLPADSSAIFSRQTQSGRHFARRASTLREVLAMDTSELDEHSNALYSSHALGAANDGAALISAPPAAAAAAVATAAHGQGVAAEVDVDGRTREGASLQRRSRAERERLGVPEGHSTPAQANDAADIDSAKSSQTATGPRAGRRVTETTRHMQSGDCRSGLGAPVRISTTSQPGPRPVRVTGRPAPKVAGLIASLTNMKPAWLSKRKNAN